MTTTHKHQTILQVAAEELLDKGRIETFDAVYNWMCPDCGARQRTTRLADTVYTLRHAYGWVIETDQPDKEQLAAYKLVKAGDMPGDESKGPHPRQLVRDTEVKPQASIHDYDGKPIPVEAIPSPERWECANCGHIVKKPIGQPQLGGYRRAPCPHCGVAKRGPDVHGRVFVPVK